MNKICFLLLCIVSLCLSSCMKSGNVQHYYDVPAVVKMEPTIGQPVLITTKEVFVAPELREYFQYAILQEGEAVLAAFSLDPDQEPIQGYRTVLEFDCFQVGITAVAEEKDVDKTAFLPIQKIEPFALIVHEKILVMYVAFNHNTTFRKYAYTITYEPDETAEIPMLSIRARAVGDEYPTASESLWPYVFEMYDYIQTLPKDAQNQVRINLRYKTGVDNDGNEVWTTYANNPLIIPLK